MSFSGVRKMLGLTVNSVGAMPEGPCEPQMVEQDRGPDTSQLVSAERSNSMWLAAGQLASELATTLKELQQSHDATLGELSTKSADVVRLSQVIDAQTRIRDRLENGLVALREDHAALLVLNRDLTGEAAAARAELAVVKHEFDSVVADRDRAEADLKTLRSRLADIESDRDILSKQNAEARNAVVDLDARLGTLREEHEQALAERDESRSEADQQRKQANDLSRQLNLVVLENGQLKEALEANQTEAAERLRRDSQDLQALRKALAQAQLSISNLNRERDQLASELRQLENRNFGLVSRSQTTEKLLSSAREKFFSVSKELRTARSTFKAEEREKANLLLQLAARTKETAAATENHKALAADNASLRSTIVELSARLRNQAEALGEAERVSHSHAEMLAQVRARAEERERDFTMRLAEAESRVRNLENEREVLEGRLTIAREYRNAANANAASNPETSASIIPLNLSKSPPAAE